jgi:hypothetical protein
MSRLTLLLSTMLTAVVLSGSALAEDTSAANETFALAVDQARVVRIDRPATNVMVGNPAIADAAMRDPSTAFVLGRNFGVTNLIFLDSEGKEVANIRVSVGRLSSATVTLNRGAGQYTYACAPGCDRVLFPTDADFRDLQPNADNKIGMGVNAANKGSAGQE